MKRLLGILLVLSSLHGMSKAPTQTAIVAEELGVKTLGYEDPSRVRPVMIELWYPALATAGASLDQPLDYDQGWVHPKALRNAHFSAGKRPLIVISHGNGGDRRDMSWLAEHLVRQGYIVAAVEHHGNSSTTYDAEKSLRFWDRSLDISFAITKLLEEPSLQGRIDADRIGLVGYSLGGMTTLSIAGAKAEYAREAALQLQKARPELSVEMIEKIDFAPSKQSYRDPRVKAIALFSPATFVYPTQSLKQIQVPVALVASDGDEVLPFKDHSFRLISEKIPSKLKLLKDKVSHYVFLNRVSEQGKVFFSKEVIADSIEAHRAKFHKEIGPFVSDFFKDKL